MPRFDWTRVFLRAATCAVATTGAACVASKLATGRGAPALNATSHIVWGERAFDVDDADLKHTLVGALLNAAAMLAWSTVYELLPEQRAPRASIAKAAGVTIASYVTDYYLIPKRLTPGFEERISPRALGAVYVALGLGLFGSTQLAASNSG